MLFVLAALVEGYVSASSLPYWAKASVAILSGASILTYLALGGRGTPSPHHARAEPPRSLAAHGIDVNQHA